MLAITTESPFGGKSILGGKYMKKRLLAVFLAFAIVLMLLPTTVFAAEDQRGAGRPDLRMQYGDLLPDEARV